MSDNQLPSTDYYTQEFMNKRKKQQFLTRVVAPIALAGSYSLAGLTIDSVPFPGKGLIGGEQVKNERNQQYRVSGSNSDSNLPTLNRDIEPATDKQASYARELAGSDGIIDKNERNAACLQANSDQAQVDALNEVFVKVRQKKIKGVRLSSPRLNGCSQEVQQ